LVFSSGCPNEAINRTSETVKVYKLIAEVISCLKRNLTGVPLVIVDLSFYYWIRVKSFKIIFFINLE